MLPKGLITVSLLICLVWTNAGCRAEDLTAEQTGQLPKTAAVDQVGNIDRAAEPQEKQPYIGIITGDDVNIRSGPAQAYYPVGQLDKDDKIIVVEEKHGDKNWGRIEPTGICFSYIAKEFVKLTGQETLPGGEGVETIEAVEMTDEQTPDQQETLKQPGDKLVYGVVAGDNVRVRAGSIKVPPVNAHVVQRKLNKGQIIQIIGERDDYYKIVCPEKTYFWVCLDFVEPTGLLTEEIAGEIRRQIAYNNANMSETAEENAMPQQDDRKTFNELAKLLRAEQKKPVTERDFTDIQKKLDTLAEQTQIPAVKVNAEALRRQMLRCQMAVDAVKTSQQQDQQLQIALSNIDHKVEQLVAVHSPPEKRPEDIVVKGRLANSAVFTAQNENRRFLVLDDHQRILCYAIAQREGLDLAGWMDKRVSLIGRAQYDAFSKIRIVYVNSVVELPTE